MKLSIIICVYNTPIEYLSECLRSITESTLGGGVGVSRTDYEILMIDDGSSIDYSALVSEYGVRYRKTENRGIFLARLLGIELAEGEYIAFADSDDTVTVNYHLPMLRRAEETGADIIINDWAFRTDRSRYYCKDDTTVSLDLSLVGDECLSAFTGQRGRMHSFYVLWNKLFRAEVLKKVRERVESLASGEERFNYSEDALMTFFAFLFAKRVENLHTGYYFYRIHDSQSVTVASEGKLKRQIECMGITLSVMKENVKGLPLEEKLCEDIDEWRRLMSRTHYSHARGARYASLYPLILKTYGVARLEKSTREDGSAYASTVLLGSNVEEIDRSLLAIFRGGGTVLSEGLGAYAKRAVSSMRDVGGRVELSDETGARIPMEHISFKRRVYHNPLVYRIGMTLFPKGSRLRAFLKRRL